MSLEQIDYRDRVSETFNFMISFSLYGEILSEYEGLYKKPLTFLGFKLPLRKEVFVSKRDIGNLLNLIKSCPEKGPFTVLYEICKGNFTYQTILSDSKTDGLRLKKTMLKYAREEELFENLLEMYKKIRNKKTLDEKTIAQLKALEYQIAIFYVIQRNFNNVV